MPANDKFNPRCPACDMLVDAANNRFVPFCSNRCRLIDLGRWLNEEHRVPCEAEEEEEETADSGRTAGPKLPPGWHDA